MAWIVGFEGFRAPAGIRVRGLAMGLLIVATASACGSDPEREQDDTGTGAAGGVAGAGQGGASAASGSGGKADGSGGKADGSSGAATSGTAGGPTETECSDAESSGETCDEAIDVSCGGTFTGSTLDAVDDYQTCNTGGVFGGDRAYVIHTPTAQRFTARVEPQASTPDYQIAVHVKRNCAQMFECLSESNIRVTDGVPGTVQNVFDLGAGETAFVIVDGVSNPVLENVNGDYSLTISASSAAAATTCDDAIDVSAGGSYGSTTLGAGDDYNGTGCAVEKAGTDRVYSIMTSESRSFDLRLDTSSGSGSSDLVMYVRTDCGTQDCVPEVQDGMLGSPTRLLLTTAPGTRYYIIVDGDMAPGVNYILHVYPTVEFGTPPPEGMVSRG